jgi:hypothetical protein
MYQNRTKEAAFLQQRPLAHPVFYISQWPFNDSTRSSHPNILKIVEISDKGSKNYFVLCHGGKQSPLFSMRLHQCN